MDTKRLNRRTTIIVAILTFVMIIFTLELYKLQVIEGETYLKRGSTYQRQVNVAAARGSILDRNGQVLVSNRPGYNITLNSYVLLASKDIGGTILELADICADNGIEHIDTLPISSLPFEYEFGMVASDRVGYFKKFLAYKNWDPDISADNLIKLMKKAYKVSEDYSEEEARTIIGVRYELELRYVVNISPYVFAEDVDVTFLPVLKEKKLPGVELETVTFREYKTEYAAHILGRTALMSPEEYKEYKELGYAMDAYVGKDGLEKAFESYLRGVDGTKAVTTSSEGKVVEESYISAPEPGDNIVLTIDIQMQEVAEKSLEQCILDLRGDGISTGTDGKDAAGGSVVVLDVNTGEILASASYPTYDITSYSKDFLELSSDPNAPFLNRVLMAAYEPGSTYKMAVAVAAMEEGVITPNTKIKDEGIYTFYEKTEENPYMPVCSYWNKTGLTHGTINVSEAISVSCNYFFYETGRLLGIDKLDEYAMLFGLGEATGVELPEKIGLRANRQTRQEKAGVPWYSGDTLQAAIGQSDNVFTPLQLASYTATLANGGTRYNAHFLDKVLTNDFTQIVAQTEVEALSELDISKETLKAVFDGMLMTSTEGTAVSTFENYPVNVCSKTGTAQHGGAGSDNATFACFAPYENPEIAIVIFVEKAGQGGRLAPVAKDIMDYYFAGTNTADEIPMEFELIK